MSAEAQPISPIAFAEAIKELPLSSLYAKVSELRNSISHLTRSNEELRTYIIESEEGPDSPDNKELEAYVLENEEVMQAMAERIRLLKVEVEGRGQRWMEEVLEDGDGGEIEEDAQSPPLVNGVSSHEVDGVTDDNSERRVNGLTNPSNRQDGDGEEQRNGDDEDDEGIYL
ncbi:conserved hypothetical protein [Talaromyces stipitatus ATCC 10500]|uniref:Uncharacterized protein n=1 Tax=Talaromyces stipitatus (strain ATCC 10500 / CBS 375.48 / QM 6759 / NRRL 1006) TaxID=441959 RepID=B8M750_TALSN|nr:uncharacterized protein TSTA_035000 [Talaromyces stipitatus ATCC 10500]EED20269.1 conserved hypothetical protein [Talaromyces stipitatus ATCC 10500]